MLDWGQCQLEWSLKPIILNKELSILKCLKGRDITLTIRKSSLFISLQTRRTTNLEIKTVRNKAVTMAAQRLQEQPTKDADLVQQGSALTLNLRVWVGKRERGVCSQGRRPTGSGGSHCQHSQGSHGRCSLPTLSHSAPFMSVQRKASSSMLESGQMMGSWSNWYTGANEI